jgi:hypothetical protein
VVSELFSALRRAKPVKMAVTLHFAPPTKP